MHNLKLGLEVEFFATQKGKAIDVSQLSPLVPTDEYPLLAEARGQPSTCSYQAVASVQGEIARMVGRLQSAKAKPLFIDWLKQDEHVQALHREALRRGMNKRINWQNLYGLLPSEKNKDHVPAGMHISFTCPVNFTHKDGSVVTANGMFDFYKVFLALEAEFGAEIDKSERVRGFYELKYDGRIEYRSLPATLIRDRKFPVRLARALAAV